MRHLLTALLISALAGCAAITDLPIGTAPAVDPNQDGPPLNPMDVSTKPLPIPKNEPRIRRGNVSPYTVFGQQYRVMPTAEGYQEIGTASWYGRKFHGRLTSSGEVYDMFEFTAAHKSLPIPSYVQVTNLANSERIVVRVNDRGPFAKGRIIDLSWAAAERLGFAGRGTARVELKILAHPDAVDGPAADSAQATYQVLALSDQDRATQEVSRILTDLNWSSGQGEARLVTIGTQAVWRVLLMPASVDQAQELIRRFPSAKTLTE